uniref:Uncharacterized protein n=1 Tax=Arundo donax TaxID=35708 RepID=A0A0A9H0M1_ARUDO
MTIYQYQQVHPKNEKFESQLSITFHHRICIVNRFANNQTHWLT